ncbi:MAG: glycoside hydrolase [Firmicutes bacterium]|nr:glycoside hydrolase [Bacillota bacterium]
MSLDIQWLEDCDSKEKLIYFCMLQLQDETSIEEFNCNTLYFHLQIANPQTLTLNLNPIRSYTYGPPMAVAPINQVEKVVLYAVNNITPDKILLGIPNYGYDWALPFVKGVSRANSIGNQRAVQIAVENGSPIQYDTVAQAPFFRYKNDGVEHEVWFEDVRSIQAKYELLYNYSLFGSGYWNSMRPFAQNWAFISTQYNVKKFV